MSQPLHRHSMGILFSLVYRKGICQGCQEELSGQPEEYVFHYSFLNSILV